MKEPSIKAVNKNINFKPYPRKKSAPQYIPKHRSFDLDSDKSLSVQRSIRHHKKIKVESDNITFYSGNFVDSIINLIENHTIALGCIAWLSNIEVLKSLKSLDFCSFIVGYENYLFKDKNANGKWPDRIRTSYRQLNPIPLNMFNGVLHDKDGKLDSVKYIGFSGMKKTYMHNKFIIFGKVENGKLKPLCVWTGSVNFSQNADRLLDNAVLIKDQVIVKCYYDLFQELSTFSEPIDYLNK